MAAESPHSPTGGVNSDSFLMVQKHSQDTVLCLSFNQNATQFICGMQKGFRIYTCNPPKEIFRLKVNVGGIRMAEMLHNGFLIAFATDGTHPIFPRNAVVIFREKLRLFPPKFFPRDDELRAIKLTRDRLVVVTERKVHVYCVEDVGIELLQEVSTVCNPYGLCAVSQFKNNGVVVFPGSAMGEVRVDSINEKKCLSIAAHNSELASLALTFDGNLVATASSKGTVIRIFSTDNGDKVHEFRRGTFKAEIHGMAWSINKKWLALSSQTGTIHVFFVNSKSPQSVLQGLLPTYFSCEKSFAQLYLPGGVKYSLAFGDSGKGELFVLNTDGSFFECSFDTVDGGEMVVKRTFNLLDLKTWV